MISLKRVGRLYDYQIYHNNTKLYYEMRLNDQSLRVCQNYRLVIFLCNVTSNNRNRNGEVVIMFFSESVYLSIILLTQTQDIGSYQTEYNNEHNIIINIKI